MNQRQTGRNGKLHEKFAVGKFRMAACLFFLMGGIMTVTLMRSESIRFFENRRNIKITAHRGASHGAPENTRASIILAIAEQADYAEIDVRLTADGVPVLMHDRTTFRTTGKRNTIDKLTYKELASYDAGIGYGAEFAGEKVPGLRDILEEFGRIIKFNIELKERDNSESVRVVVSLIEELGLQERCLITSDSYEQLERVKKMNKKIRTGYIMSLVYGEIFGYAAADFFSIKSDSITEQLVKGAHARGKEIHAWTVNKEYEIKRMRELGVDNIITDNPAYVRNVLQ